jgi:protein-tyrosine phosphatase
MNILFVCSANVSRSFLAEVLLTHELRQRGLEDISVASAGIYSFPGNSPDPKMVEYLEGMGIPLQGHSARRITREDVDWADLILVMEQDHATAIAGMWPEAIEKVELLSGSISDGQAVDDIADPFGRSSYHYRLAQAQISIAIDALVKRLLKSA